MNFERDWKEDARETRRWVGRGILEKVTNKRDGFECEVRETISK